MLGFGVLLNVSNRFSNAGFGKAHVMCCQVLFPIILNPCVFQGKFYPHVSDLFTPNSSKYHLEKAAIGALSTPVAFFLSFSSCNQLFHLASTKQVQVLLGKLADEGMSLCLQSFLQSSGGFSCIPPLLPHPQFLSSSLNYISFCP